MVCKCVDCNKKCIWAFDIMTCCGCDIIFKKEPDCPYTIPRLTNLNMREG